jgi:hypothetical protein
MLLRSGQRLKFGRLSGREKPVGDFQRRLTRPAVLYVDSNHAAGRNTQ